MRLSLRIIITLLTVLLISFIGFHIFVNLKGKEVLVRKLQEATRRKVTITSLNTTFPFNIHIRDLEVEGLFKIDRVYAAGAFLDILRRGIGFYLVALDHPVVTLERGANEPFLQAIIPLRIEPVPENLSETPPETENKVSGPKPPKIAQAKSSIPALYIAHLIIRDGNVTFIDRLATKEGLTIKAEDLNIKVDNLSIIRVGPGITSFELKAKIPWREGAEEGKIAFEGWFNWLKKDMQATLKITDIDAIALYPYYSNWVDLEKARIERAKLAFSSNINGLNNDVVAQCHLELTDIVFKPRSPEEEEQKAERIAGIVLDIFRTLNQGKVVLDFPIRTKMDRPQFGFINIRDAVESKLTAGAKTKGVDVEDVVLFPAKIFEGTIKGAADVSKAIVGGTVSIGSEFVRSLLGAFKKEKKE